MQSSRMIDRIEVTFDDPKLVADAGLPGAGDADGPARSRGLVNQIVRPGRAGWAGPGRAERCSPWWRRSSPGDPTSITSTGCAPGRPPGPAVSGDGAVDAGDVPAGPSPSGMSASSTG